MATELPIGERRTSRIIETLFILQWAQSNMEYMGRGQMGFIRDGNMHNYSPQILPVLNVIIVCVHLLICLSGPISPLVGIS